MTIADAYMMVLVASLPSRVRLFQPHALQPARFLCPWDSPGRNPEAGCHSLLWGSS